MELFQLDCDILLITNYPIKKRLSIPFLGKKIKK